MEKWKIIAIILAIYVILLEIKNRRLKPVYKKVEAQFAELLEGRFVGNPVNRRSFMRALVRYATTQTSQATRIVLGQAQGVMRRCSNPKDVAACELLCGLCLEELQDHSAASEMYKSALEHDPDYSIAANKLAHSYSVMQDPRGVEMYAELLQVNPDDKINLNNYASALIRMNKNREAIVQLEKLLRLDEKFISAYELLALAYANLRELENMENAVMRGAFHGVDETRLREILVDVLKD